MELEDFKFQLISLLLWLASGKKGNVTEEGFTRVKRLMNPRLREVSLARDHTISEAARSLSHFTLQKIAHGLLSKGESAHSKMNPTYPFESLPKTLLLQTSWLFISRYTTRCLPVSVDYE